MDSIVFQQTDRTNFKSYPKFKIYENKAYYLWNERDADNTTQVWFAVSNLAGSDFAEMQLTNSTNSVHRPELYIYNDKIYMTWYEISEETGKYQIWISSMNLDASDFTIIYTTNYGTGARNPKIAIKKDIIYLAYEMGAYTPSIYRHMVRAKINIDGSNFYESAASYSSNETVKNVELFVSEDPTDTKVYYIWARNYPIGATPDLYIYSADEATLNFEKILAMDDAAAGNLQFKDDKIYFAWTSHAGEGNKFSVINANGTGRVDILDSYEHNFSLFEISQNTEGNTIIDFAYSTKTSSSWPISKYQLSSSVLNLDTLEYFETELVSEITISSNNEPDLQFNKDNNLHYVWTQYDKNRKYQIWTQAVGNLSYLTTTLLDGPTAVWSNEVATYNIQIQNTGFLVTSGTIEMYTYTVTNELIIFETIIVPEIQVGNFVTFIIDVDTTGLPDGAYSMCAKTNYEEYI